MTITPAGEFLDTQFPEIGTDKIVLHLADPKAVTALRHYISEIEQHTPDLAEAIGRRLEQLHRDTTKEG